jgi:hypothetical protein
MEILTDYLPFLIPLLVIQIALQIAALIHIFTNSTYRVGNRILWVIITICLNSIGPVLYFFIGRDEQGANE